MNDVSFPYMIAGADRQARDRTLDSWHVREWNHDEWNARELQWTELLARSEADPLFLSWDWLTRWWRIFGDQRGRALHILAAYRGDALVGIAPLYRSRARRWGIVDVRSLQIAGLAWRDGTSQISEYADIIALPAERDRMCQAVAQVLAPERWNEFVVGFADRAGGIPVMMQHLIRENGGYCRELEGCVSYQADLSQGFAGYLRELGESSRRSIWNLRRRLTNGRQVTVQRTATADVSRGFSDLNLLHVRRWGEPVFTGERLQFHKSLATRLAERGQLVLSRLLVDGRAVSVLYDIRIGERQYNLQIGFDPGFDSRLSLGLLHFGYAMEEAAAAGVKVYDFLAGPGRTTNYKRHLSQHRRELTTIQYVRGPMLPRLYRWRDARTRASQS